MALDKNALRDALIAAFQQGMDDPDWSQEDSARALAEAIDAYVRAADVRSVVVDVVDPGGAPLGSGTQVGSGTLE
ncbi:MAG: hypothetical protein AAF682_04050 [Planctomycetota bacterium]